MNRFAAVFLLLVGVLWAGNPPVPPTGEKVEIVSVEATGRNLRALAEIQADVLKAGAGRIVIVATPEDLGRLSVRGIPFTVETASFAPAHRVATAAAGGINGDFHSYLELESELMALESAHPETVKILSIGTSLEGRNLYAAKIGVHPEQDAVKPGLLILGCHHAREWISVDVPLRMAAYLAENAASDPAVAGLLARGEIWIVPLVNPDGLEYSIDVYRYWRKNRRVNADGSFGVDLNRNYGFMWGFDDAGSSPSPVSEVYRGPSAFSEPETRAVRDLFLGRDFRAVVSFHSFAEDILYPWGYADVATDKDALLSEIGLEMADLIRAVNGRAYLVGRASSALYVTNGDTTDWTFAERGVPSYTIELPPLDIELGGFFNAEADIDGIFRENLPAMLALAERTLLGRDGARALRHEKGRPASPLTKRPQKLK